MNEINCNCHKCKHCISNDYSGLTSGQKKRAKFNDEKFDKHYMRKKTKKFSTQRTKDKQRKNNYEE